MTDEQKAALDLAILNLRTHGDDQLLSAVKPLIEFYESRVLAERKPTAWVRYRSDGGFEGPIMDTDERMCDTRRKSGAWTPLYAAPLANPSDKQEAVAEIVRYETFTGRTAWDIKIRDTSLKNGALLYAAPLAQSAEQDRIDAERYRWLRVQDDDDFCFAVVKNAHFDLYESPEELDAAIDAAKGASK
jgi:hypothetical protein